MSPKPPKPPRPPVPPPVPPPPATPIVLSDTIIAQGREWGDGRLASNGPVAAVIYQRLANNTYETRAWLRGSVDIPLPDLWADGRGEFVLTDEAVIVATAPYHVTNQLSVITYPLDGSPSSLVSFGDANSRPAGLARLASGALVVAWWQFDLASRWGPMFLAYRYPNGDWTDPVSVATYTLSSFSQLVQHSDGKVWLFTHADSLHQSSAFAFTETPDGLAVSYANTAWLSDADGQYNMDSEVPRLSASGDDLAYESADRMIVTTSPLRTVSRPAIANVRSDGGRSFTAGPAYVERLDCLGLSGDLLVYRPVDLVTFEAQGIYAARHGLAGWSLPVHLCDVTWTVLPDRPLVAHTWIGFVPSRTEFAIAASDGNMHFYELA